MFRFRSVEDVDLLVAGLSETPLEAGLVGPTFSCILGNQYKNLRRADRFWYESKSGTGFKPGTIDNVIM